MLESGYNIAMNGGDADILSRVAKEIRDKRLFSAGSTVLAAISGGADSMALLSVLYGIRKDLGICLHVAHFEHGIRGEASREDAHFVKIQCDLREVPCHIGHGDVPRLAHQWKCSLEDAARRARYAFLEDTAERIGACRIALAHQMEDQAETLLLHLVRGCGLDGLAGMRPLSGIRARPLLGVSRQEIVDYLTEAGIPWREDATNQDTVHTRNFIRQEVFPLLRRLNPRVAQAMCRTAAHAALAVDAQHLQDEALLFERVKLMPYGAFWRMPDSVISASACRTFAAMCKVPPLEARHVKTMMSLPIGDTANLPGGWKALRTRERLHLLAGEYEQPHMPQGDFIRTDCAKDDFGDGVRSQTFDADAIQGAAFRFRQDGDVFAPLGSLGTQKLKKALQGEGIDRPFRNLLPVFAKGNRILWIVGLKPGRDAAIVESTHKAIKIVYKGSLPWEL